MSDKFNLEGFSVDENNICTASGGFVGDVTGDVTGTCIGTFVNSGATAFLADGVILPTSGVVILDSTSATTQMTLGDQGNGYHLAIAAKRVVNTCDITAFFGGTTITTVTFTAEGQGVMLASMSGQWYIVGNNGATLS